MPELLLIMLIPISYVSQIEMLDIFAGERILKVDYIVILMHLLPKAGAARMRKLIQSVALLYAGLYALSSANAQIDPRPALGTLITQFQTCRSPQVLQMLSPAMLNVVVQQTGGSGCYVQMQGAGPIQGMQVIGAQDFPVGPLFLVRVQHQAGPADWFIGFNRFTGKVEYLAFQPAQAGVSIPTGPGPTASGPGPGASIPPPPDGSGSASAGGTGAKPEGCDLYPAMCQ